ncbi:MAG TPA: CrcB family protein, partial [Iamia sp.]
AGAVLRHLVATGFREARHGILVVNVVGSLALGLLVGSSPTTVVVLGTGFCGALTTWSTFAHDVATEVDRRAAAIHVVVSITLGLSAASVGLSLR